MTCYPEDPMAVKSTGPVIAPLPQYIAAWRTVDTQP